MFKRFFPDEYLESAYAVDYDKMYRDGYRGLLFDIDNTLVPHGAKADRRAKQLFERLKKAGFRICLISNNKIGRVEMFNKDVQVSFIHDAHKPSVKSYLKAMHLLKTNKSNTLFIGDQLFTDIFGAKRTGLKTILVKPIHPKEEIQIVLKRYLEKIVLYFYLKEKQIKEKA